MFIRLEEIEATPVPKPLLSLAQEREGNKATTSTKVVFIKVINKAKALDNNNTRVRSLDPNNLFIINSPYSQEYKEHG